MHPGFRRQSLGLTHPVSWDIQFPGIDGFGLVGAGVTAHQLATAVENFYHHRTRGCRLQIVVNHRAVRRVLTCGYFRRQRRVGVLVATHAIGGLWRKEIDIGLSDLLVHLTERRDVIENPEATTMGADD